MRAKKIFEEEEFMFMKGPSKEKILNGLEGKSIEDKFQIAVELNLLSLVNECIENGLDTSNYRIDQDNNWWYLDDTWGYLHTVTGQELWDHRIICAIHSREMMEYLYNHIDEL